MCSVLAGTESSSAPEMARPMEDPHVDQEDNMDYMGYILFIYSLNKCIYIYTYIYTYIYIYIYLNIYIYTFKKNNNISI